MDDKYKFLLDTETQAFVALTQSFFPANSEQLSISEQRRYYDRMCKAFSAEYPDGITTTDENIETSNGGMPSRQYQFANSPAVASVVYYHGGGYVVGGLESHDDVCAEICARTGFSVTAIDYRLAPEHIYPADFNDAMSGFEHVAGSTDLPVIVVGDSAGGNLAAAVCHATRCQAKRPAGQVLIYPGLGSDMTGGSFVEHGNAPMLTIKETTFYKQARSGGNNALLAEPTCNPLNDTDFSGLPPTVIISAQCDPLSDDGKRYQQLISKAGSKVAFYNEKGLVHGFLRARHSVKRAGRSFTRIVKSITTLGEGRWPG